MYVFNQEKNIETYFELFPVVNHGHQHPSSYILTCITIWNIV